MRESLGHHRGSGSPSRRRAAWALAIASLMTLPAGAAVGDGRSLRERLQGSLVGAHRGGRHHDDENTLRRFEAARRAGADIIETDLHATRDGQVVLIHDARLDDWTDCRGWVRDKSLQEIRACRLRGSDLPLDTFEDALRWSAGRVVLDAEFKDRRAVEPAVHLVQRYDAYGWVYFQVRNGTDLYDLARSLDPEVALVAAPRGPGAQQLLDRLLALGDENLLVIELHPEIRTAANIEAIHEAGKLASENAWHFGAERTWYRKQAMCSRVFARGIDIAITDLPASCVRQRDRGSKGRVPSAWGR